MHSTDPVKVPHLYRVYIFNLKTLILSHGTPVVTIPQVSSLKIITPWSLNWCHCFRMTPPPPQMQGNFKWMGAVQRGNFTKKCTRRSAEVERKWGTVQKGEGRFPLMLQVIQPLLDQPLHQWHTVNYKCFKQLSELQFITWIGFPPHHRGPGVSDLLVRIQLTPWPESSDCMRKGWYNSFIAPMYLLSQGKFVAATSKVWAFFFFAILPSLSLSLDPTPNSAFSPQGCISTSFASQWWTCSVLAI